MPDELVQAAAEALSNKHNNPPSTVDLEDVRVALQAAFAKLGERSAQDAPVWYSADEAAAWAAGWDALAREFGGRE